ncbi:thymidylate synthase (FAD) [Thermanaeromonas toyohensis ToBE]|uniref:FAD-dependent thymidylate synthase n=1 Tax=Thermanaeromonas toyohensis ToBE TaxID=698762 RepID=A0A1W1VRX5_9FIRM|nr:FAD-dependent thymidylate synthase [Thermanaeromonas toyohensis]SMB96132.1 thymidylate synthase (FAD) [Thermanaeromonas toyohensis ToBE]
MRVIRPYVCVPAGVDGEAILRRIERVGRVCYKSEDRITEGSARQFVASLIRRGHESVLEHEKLTVRIVCDRGVSHELVRHRIASYSQESTRFCSYASERFKEEITVVAPCLSGGPEAYAAWHNACLAAEQAYLSLVRMGVPAEQARSVLPHSLKTEVVVTANLREWRHIFRLRADRHAHIEMRRIMVPLLLHFRRVIPIVFDDVGYDESLPHELYAEVFEEAW